MAKEVCLVRIRRYKPNFKGLVLDVGHEWIEILDENGIITFSAGFGPSGNIWYSSGKVEVPDSYAGDKINTNTIEVKRNVSGKGITINCDDKNCDDIRTCVRKKAKEKKSYTYKLFSFNCRHWVTKILAECCIIKG